MRRFNARLIKIILILLLFHALAGAFKLLGLNHLTFKPLSYAMLALILLHGFIGFFLSREAIRAGLESAHWYFRENASFWTGRISGLLILLLLWFHITAYTVTLNGILFLQEFTLLRFLSQLLFIAAILVHLIAAAKPWLLKQGILAFKERTWDYILIFTLSGLFCMAAVIFYFIYWNC